ncbi:MAG TPA: hypothetical protein VMT52_01705 [Planctomycetota bacterium]|nr:hypothetical protein [Planctomycetota bacterium]
MRSTRILQVFIALLGAAAMLSSAPLAGADVPSPPAPKPGPQAPRLSISADGALLDLPGRLPRRFRSFEDLVREAPGLEGAFIVLERKAEPDEEKDGPARSARRERGVRIARGEVSAMDMLRFLSDYTGLPILHDSTDKGLDRTIVIPSEIVAADDRMLRSILQANRILVHEGVTSSGERVLEVSTADSPAGPDVPEPRPIIEVSKARDAEPARRRRGTRIARAPDDAPGAFDGVVLEAIPDVVRAQVDLDNGLGMLVTEVGEGAGRRKGGLGLLQRHDILTHVGTTPVTSARRFADAWNSMATGEEFEIRVLRKGILRILRAVKGR